MADWRGLLPTEVYVIPGLPVLVIDELGTEGLVAVLASLHEQADAIRSAAPELSSSARQRAGGRPFQFGGGERIVAPLPQRQV